MIERVLFRPVELWVVALVVLAMSIGAILFGWAVQHEASGGTRFGSFGKVITATANIPSTIREVLNSTESPYLIDEVRFSDKSGFKFHYPAFSRPNAGYLLLNRHDGDLNIGISELVDLNSQETIHRWLFDVDPLWDDLSIESGLYEPAVDRSTFRFRPIHALLQPDGSLIAKYKTPLLRADVCGGLSIFDQTYIFHHSIEPDGDGGFWVPAYLEPKTVSLGDEKYLDDAIVHFDANGQIIYKKSVGQILLENGLEHILYAGYEKNDPTHLNDIEPVRSDGPHWRKGDLFLNLRHNSAVILYRPSSNEVVWYKTGPWVHHHDVDIFSDHQISVFSNNSYFKWVDKPRNYSTSEFMVFDFNTGETTTPFAAGFKRHDVRTPVNGRSEPVGGDELVVEETNSGRLLSFSRDGSLYWEFINRSKDGHLYELSWSCIIPREFGDRVAKRIKEARCD